MEASLYSLISGGSLQPALRFDAYRLGNIVRPVCGSFDYLIYPYNPAYHPSRYHFVISVDNRKEWCYGYK